MAGEANSPLQNSDSADYHFTSHPQTSSLGKRRKSTPVRFGDYTVSAGKTHPRHNTVVQDASSKSPSSQKGNYALTRAGEIQSSLGDQYPTCTKLLKANADPVYLMAFPQWFGKLHLPKTDCEMAFEVENGEIYNIKYIPEKTMLSAGWRKFSVTNNLLGGDVLVFQLVESLKFKVYIVRVNDSSKVDGALANSEAHLDGTHANLEAHTDGQMIPPVDKKTKRMRGLQKHTSSENSSGKIVVEDSKPNFPFPEVKSFKDFHIMVNGVSIDSELEEDIRMSYFKLCMDRKELLHKDLRADINLKLAAGVIAVTVDTANKIKNCKLTTTKEEFDAMDGGLEAFGLLGMEVRFLRERILTLSRLSEGRADVKRYVEVKKEQKRVENEIERVTEELKKLKECCDGLKHKAERLEAKFLEEVNNVPW